MTPEALYDLERVDLTSSVEAVREQAARDAKLWALFDALAEHGYCHLSLLETATPGATDALRSWASALGHTIVDRSITPPGAPGLVMLTVSVRRADGNEGARINVTRYAEAS